MRYIVTNSFGLYLTPHGMYKPDLFLAKFFDTQEEAKVNMVEGERLFIVYVTLVAVD